MHGTVSFPSVRSVADARELEVAQLLSALEDLHRDGVIDANESRTKRHLLTSGASTALQQ
jgi:hypothetical protein